MHPFPRRRGGIGHADASPREGKKFAQIGAIGLVRREIGHPFGKFFLAAVQAVRAVDRGRRRCVASSCRTAARVMPMKKMRVLPMFFFKRMSTGRIERFRRRWYVEAIAACGRRPAGPATKKKLREGVDTLKNRD